MTQLVENQIPEEEIRFDFEDFLDEHEENLPEGLDPQYLSLIPVLENPLNNLRKLPRALSTLPMNAVLHQEWIFNSDFTATTLNG